VVACVLAVPRSRVGGDRLTWRTAGADGLQRAHGAALFQYLQPIGVARGAAAEAGFDWFGPDVFSLDQWVSDGRRIEDLADLLRDRDLPCWELAALDIGDAAATIEQAKHCAALAAELGARWVLTNVSVAPEEARGTFERVCEILADAGCQPAIEYLPFTPAYSIATARVLVDHVGTDRAKILFDTWHHFRGPDGWAELEAVPLDLVAYVQFDDALSMAADVAGEDLVRETLDRRTFPGLGEFDLDRYCAVMRQKGFDGVVSVEILNDEWRADPDLRQFARRAHDTSAAFWT
jgi:sugar phosphate isomerase/epimerase